MRRVINVPIASSGCVRHLVRAVPQDGFHGFQGEVTLLSLIYPQHS